MLKCIQNITYNYQLYEYAIKKYNVPFKSPFNLNMTFTEYFDVSTIKNGIIRFENQTIIPHNFYLKHFFVFLIVREIITCKHLR